MCYAISTEEVKLKEEVKNGIFLGRIVKKENSHSYTEGHIFVDEEKFSYDIE